MFARDFIQEEVFLGSFLPGSFARLKKKSRSLLREFSFAPREFSPENFFPYRTKNSMIFLSWIFSPRNFSPEVKNVHALLANVIRANARDARSGRSSLPLRSLSDDQKICQYPSKKENTWQKVVTNWSRFNRPVKEWLSDQ